MAKTVVGSFESYQEAESVVDQLAEAGFDRNDISIMAKRPGGAEGQVETTQGTEASDTETSETASGAGKGALAGGGIGLAAGVVAVAVPGIGPVLAAGPLATALAGAGIGAAAGGAIGALANLGVEDEDAHAYAENVRRGGALVVVKADDAEAERAADIMQRYGAIDIDRRREQWRQAGWQGFDENAAPYQAGKEETIPVVEEDLAVGKREVERGRARIYAHQVEEPVHKDVRLREEEVKVERRPADRPATERDLEASRERSVEFREKGEEPVVEKKARVTEEIVANKEARERTERIDDSVRRTEVDVDEDTGHRRPPRRPEDRGKPMRP